jgi:hypothetical protein
MDSYDVVIVATGAGAARWRSISRPPASASCRSGSIVPTPEGEPVTIVSFDADGMRDSSAVFFGRLRLTQWNPALGPREPILFA